MKKSKISYYVFLGILLVILTGFTSAFGQEFRGTITGTVSDPNGAAVAGATVVVKNIETNVASTLTTNEQGSYTVPLLLPGNYSVTVTNEGFKTSTQEKINLKVDDRLTVDFRLEIGSTTEVNVIADTELIERGSVTTGTVVTQRQIEELPLAEGAAYNLVTQAPGVSYTGNPQFSGPTANGNLASFRTNGASGNQINLDGSPNVTFGGQVAYTPPADALSQFKIQTNAFDAQNGFTAGSTVNVAVKSGTNDLHGSVYYFNRNEALAANNFFSNLAGQERADRLYYRYGGQVNGPVYIPKIYNGRDKTFFMFSYEKQYNRRPEPELFDVPLTAWRNGDFSSLIVNRNNIADPANIVIYNPYSGTQSGNNVVRQSFGCNVPANTPVPAGCNIIPQNLINPAALAFLNLFPEPNLPGNVDNFFSDQLNTQPYDSYLARIDHNFNSNHRIFGKFFYSKSVEDRYNWIGTPDAYTRGFETRTNKGGNIDYTATLSSNFVLDIRSSLNEFVQLREAANPVSAGDLGFTGIASVSDSTVLPRFDFRNYATLGPERAGFNEGLVRPFKLFSLQPTLTQIFGNHTLKYGYDYRRLWEEQSTNGFNAGRFFFDGRYTTPASNSSSTLRNQTGRDIAAFLLGVATGVPDTSNSLIDTPIAYDVTSDYHGFFVQDDWRVTRKLTLNLGLRYDLESGVRESQGRIITGFDTTTPNPLRAAALVNYNANVPSGVPVTAFENLSGGYLFASSPDDPNQATDKNNFQPRIGVSYSIDDKTVIRGGFGIFTAPFQIQAVDQPGFAAPTLFAASTNNGLTFNATLNNPFPNGIDAPPGSSLGLGTFIGRDLISTNAVGPTTSILPYERQNASYARFIVGIQRELPFRIGFEATYVHSRGYDLPVSRQINYVPREYLADLNGVTDPDTITATINAVNTFLSSTVPNPFRGLVPENRGYNGNTIARRQLLTPFPQFGNIAVTDYSGTSNYNSIQFQINKRFTTSLSLDASYSYSRDKEKTRFLNPQDDEPVETLSSFDRPHRFTFRGIYELPIGRGRWIGSEWNSWVDAVFGGWQFQAVFERQSGEPLQFGNVYYNGDPSGIESRFGQKDDQGRRYGFDLPGFDTSGFLLPNGMAPGFGNNYTIGGAVLRYFPLTLDNLRNQPFQKFDAGLTKNFRIREGMKLQLRIEAINAANWVYFNAPNLDPANANFGKTNGQRNLPRDIQIGGRFSF